MSTPNRTELEALAASARAAIRDPARITIEGDDPNPRFELFHAASSLCSQKVRAVLAEKSLGWRSSEMIILGAMGPEGLVPAEHYGPAYVRLRLVAGRELATRFVAAYTGRTSVQTEGFDPCVVPLLVDYEAQRVIADSKRICSYLDSISPQPLRLVPEDARERADVMRQVGIVDEIPNLAMLYGFHPEDDRRPEALREVMQTVYDVKLMALERMIAGNANEPELVAAYRAKVVKETAGRSLCKDAKFQRNSRSHVGIVLADLERDLAERAFPSLTRDARTFTLADVVWGVNLVRMQYLGLASMWDALPRVKAYFAALVRRPSIRKEAILASMSSMPPSASMEAIAQPRA
jgi:glutathione S-transferase